MIGQGTASRARRPRETPRDRPSLLRGELAGHRQQFRARVEPDRQPATTDALGDCACDGTAAAANIEDVLAGSDV